jgi:hypothetical protein
MLPDKVAREWSHRLGARTAAKLTAFQPPDTLEFMSRKKISTTVYITPEQNAQLKVLHERTRVPMAEYIRQGIDMVLDKYSAQLPGQVDFSFDPGPKGIS